MRSNEHGAGTLRVFLLGGIVGAILGVLFAPRAGKDTRDMVANRFTEYVDVATESYDTDRERLVEVSATASGDMAEKAEEPKYTMDATSPSARATAPEDES